MSAQATAYVWEHSPYTGVKFTIHLAVADVVNDAYDNEFWMVSSNLAVKARTTPATARRVLGEFVNNGWLVRLEQGGGRRPSRFQFVFDNDSAVSTGHSTHVTGHNCRVERTQPPCDEDTGNSIELQDVTTTGTSLPQNDEVSESEIYGAAMFGQFWDIYPRKVGKWEAHKFFARLDPPTKQAAIDGAVLLAQCTQATLGKGAVKHEVVKFTPHPATWLNAGRWDDDPDDVIATYAAMLPKQVQTQLAASNTTNSVYPDINYDDQREDHE